MHYNLRIDNLRPLLCGYDPELKSILYNGFKFGVPLHLERARTSFFAHNLISARHNPEIVSAKLFKELAANHLAGPFDKPPFRAFRVSPLGVVPKKAPGEFHVSFPGGASVNQSYNSNILIQLIQKCPKDHEQLDL